MNAYCTVQQMLSIYDARVMKQLSGDQNSLAGVLPNIQFHLDMNASELDSHFYGRVELPMSAPGIPATGTISYVSVPADGSTNTISDGSTTVVFTYLSGGVATNQINTASGLVNTIAGLLAAAVNISGLKIASQSNNNVVALLNTTNPSNGTIGNVAIASSSSATVTTGMSGGGTGLPLLLTKLCAALTAASLFGRRNDLPEEVKASIQWADMWLEKFDRGEVQIPQIDRSTFPQLQDSYWVNGQSSFDWIFGTAPSPTGPTAANGQAIPPNTY